jgi:hypothetical protein
MPWRFLCLLNLTSMLVLWNLLSMFSNSFKCTLCTLHGNFSVSLYIHSSVGVLYSAKILKLFVLSPSSSYIGCSCQLGFANFQSAYIFIHISITSIMEKHSIASDPSNSVCPLSHLIAFTDGRRNLAGRGPWRQY